MLGWAGHWTGTDWWAGVSPGRRQNINNGLLTQESGNTRVKNIHMYFNKMFTLINLQVI